jgi:hypothetical protein
MCDIGKVALGFMKKTPKKSNKLKGCLIIAALMFGGFILISTVLTVLAASMTGRDEKTPTAKLETDDNQLTAEPVQTLRQEANPTPEPEPEPEPEPVQKKPESVEAKEIDWKAKFESLRDQYLSSFSPPAKGKRITIVLKNGRKHQSYLRELTDSTVTIKISTGKTTVFTRDELSNDSREICFVKDYANLRAYREVKAEKDQLEAVEKAEREGVAAAEKAEREGVAAAEKAERERIAAVETERREQVEAKQRAVAEAERKKKIKLHFSSWDGSHSGLTRVIKKSMNDPKSYDHAETAFWDMKTHLVVRTEFRGKNAFGGVVLNWVKARVDFEGNVIEIMEQGP